MADVLEMFKDAYESYQNMSNCAKCGKNETKMYDCEHTKDENYCVECYTELHYYLTEKKS